MIITVRGYPYMRSRQCERAIPFYDQALEMEPDFPLALFYRGKCYIDTGRFDDAIKDHQRAIEASGESAMFLAALGYAYARSGKQMPDVY